MAFDMGYSIETVQALMDRFIDYHKVIRYNPKTRELAIKNWGKYNLHKGGKPVIDCVISELEEVEDTTLIEYVAENIDRQDIYNIYESFFENNSELDEESIPFSDSEEPVTTHTNTRSYDTWTTRSTTRGQKEKEKEKEKQKEKQQQEVLYPSMDHDSKTEMISEIVEYWGQNGFGLNNMSAKEKLLAWLDDSSFLNPNAKMI